MAYRSKLARLLSRFRVKQEDSLEQQLHTLFKMNFANLDIAETERSIQHYLTASIHEIKLNNYFILKPWLDPIIDEKVRTLKSELGVSWALISPLVGVSIEGPFKEIDQPIEILDSLRLTQAKSHYARAKNPLGRLYEILFFIFPLSSLFPLMPLFHSNFHLISRYSTAAPNYKATLIPKQIEYTPCLSHAYRMW